MSFQQGLRLPEATACKAALAGKSVSLQLWLRLPEAVIAQQVLGGAKRTGQFQRATICTFTQTTSFRACSPESSISSPQGRPPCKKLSSTGHPDVHLSWIISELGRYFISHSAVTEQYPAQGD